MKINAITSQYKPQFKANNDFHIFGFDDETSQAKREYIREWHDKQFMPYQSIYEKEGRKSEFELKYLISDLVRKPVSVNNEKINKLGLSNLACEGKTIYRGAMVECDKLEKVKKLHEAGIRRIIPIGSGFLSLQDECAKFGIEYLPIEFRREEKAFKNFNDVKKGAEKFARYIANFNEEDVEKYMETDIRIWKKSSRIFIDNFTDYIQAMQKGNVYMGCEFGTYNTDTAVMFDYLFNPKMKHNTKISYYNKGFLNSAENLYHNLTDIDKLKMNWPKDFDKVFLERLSKLKK